MSRYYAMGITISGHTPGKQDAVEYAAEAEWNFEDWNRWSNDNGEVSLESYAESNLCGGEVEEEFAQRIAEAIWEANGARCLVRIEATCLENLPCETYELGGD